MLDHVKEKDVRVYAVWVSILPFDTEAAVPNAMKKFSDNRVSHYWDGKGELVKAYSTVLQLGEDRPAWDVFLAFGRDAEWQEAAPSPAYWMYQLGGAPAERKLDGDKLAAEVKELLKAGKPASDKAEKKKQ